MPARAGLRMFMGVKVVVRGWGWRCLPGSVVRQRLTQERAVKRIDVRIVVAVATRFISGYRNEESGKRQIPGCAQRAFAALDFE